MLTIQRRMARPFLVLLALPATAMGFALSVQIAALSWILATRYGLKIEEIGLVWAAGPMAGIVGQLLIGIVSDRVWFWNGRRRPFIVIGGVLSSLMILALPNIGRISQALGFETVLGVAIAVALALDLSINVSFNPTRSVITDVTREGPERTRGYTWMQTVSGLFGVLAYAIGALFGNYVLIYLGAVLVLGFSIVPALLIAEPRVLPGGASPPGSAAHATGFGKLLVIMMPLWGFLAYDLYAMTLKILRLNVASYLPEYACAALTLAGLAWALAARDRGIEFVKEDLVEFRKVLAAHSFSWIGVQTMFVYMIVFVQHRFPGLDADAAGRVLARSFLVLSAVAALAPTLLLEPLTRRYSQTRVHAACLAVMTAGFTGIYLYGMTPLSIYALMAVAGVGWAAIVSLPFAIMSQRVQQSRIGLYMGVFNLSVVLPQLVVSLGVGSLIGRLEDKGVIFVIGAASVGCSALAWMFLRRAGDGEAASERLPASH